MNQLELREKLNLLGVKEYQYSLNGDLAPDRIILFHNHNEWQVFYLDERGTRNNVKIFESEEAACLYIYQLFYESSKISRQFRIKT